MKLSFTLAFVILSVYLVNARREEEEPLQPKIILRRQPCPLGSSKSECQDYANTKFQSACRYVYIGDNMNIEWQNCARDIDCPYGEKFFDGNSRLSFPDCCGACIPIAF